MLYDIETRHGFHVVFANIIAKLLQFTKPQNAHKEKKSFDNDYRIFFPSLVVMILHFCFGKFPLYLSLL